VSDIASDDAFGFVLRVTTQLDQAGQSEQGSAFWLRAYPLHDYGRALVIAREYVEVIP
jgi:hypothetical protein